MVVVGSRCGAAGLLLVALGAPASAGAADRTSTDDLAVRGVAVSWPIAANTTKVAPGTKLRVTFERRGGRGRPRFVDVRVVRLSKSGKRLHTLRRQRLRRSGKVVVQLPAATGRRYLVTVRTGKMRSRTIVKTAAPLPLPLAAPAPLPVPTPAPPIPVEDGLAPPVVASEPAPVAPIPTTPAPAAPEPTCNFIDSVLDLRRPTAALHIAQHAARPGEQRAYEIENTSPRCIFGGTSYFWERYAGERWGVERWSSVPNSPALPYSPVVIGLAPGRRWSGSVSVPDNAVPGRYRLTVRWFVSGSLTAQFEVAS